MSKGCKVGMAAVVFGIIAISILSRVPLFPNPAIDFSIVPGFGAKPEPQGLQHYAGLIISLALLAAAFWAWLGGSLRGKFFLVIMLGHFLFNGAGKNPVSSGDPFGTIIGSVRGSLGIGMMSAYRQAQIILSGALWLLSIAGLALALLTLKQGKLDERLDGKFPRRPFCVYIILLSLASLSPWLIRVICGLARVLKQVSLSGGHFRIGFGFSGFVAASVGQDGIFETFLGAPDLLSLALVVAAVLVLARKQEGYFLFGACIPIILRWGYVFSGAPIFDPGILGWLYALAGVTLAITGLFFTVLLLVRFGPPRSLAASAAGSDTP